MNNFKLNTKYKCQLAIAPMKFDNLMHYDRNLSVYPIYFDSVRDINRTHYFA